MNTTYHPRLHQYSVFVALWTVLLFFAGALVTSHDAALSVPDWPKSFGTWFPTWRMLAGGAFFEHAHRVLAGVLGVLTLVLAILIWRKDQRRWMRWLGVMALAAVLVQAELGGQVVRQLLRYWLPVMHACLAQLFFAAVFSIAVFNSRWWVSEQQELEDRFRPAVHTVALVNAVVIFFQVFLGAGFRHKEIAIWPHALGALLVMATITWTAIVLRRRFSQSREISKARILLHALFGMQLLLGFGAWISRITTSTAIDPVPSMIILTVVHTVVGALLFAVSVAVVLMCYRLVPRRRQVAAVTERQAAV